MAKKKLKSKMSKHSAGAKQLSGSGPINDEVIAAALITVPPPVLMKVCRLCETKDGPFLNIFDADKVIAKKIEELMPFGIAENDDLPHKICFRCSAKVEELHEFIQKCIRTQENLQKAIGNEGPLTMKSRTRVVWEQQLNKTKMSNDDICDVLIKRAMEGIPLNAPLDIAEEKPPPAKTNNADSPTVNEISSDTKESSSDDDADDVSLKQVKLSIGKSEEVPVTRLSRSSKADAFLLDGIELTSKRTKGNTRSSPNKPAETKPEALKSSVSSAEVVPENKEPEVEKPKETTPPFNIMDHVSIIKVNGVGILFQCKLCNRNFLKKDIVMNHGCAKNNVPKEINQNTAAKPEVPKPSTVKYLKMDKDFKKSSVSPSASKPVEKPPVPEPPKPVEPEVPKPKPKPRIGPASRVKNAPPKQPPKEPTPPPKPTPPEAPSFTPGTPVNFPSVPSLNSRYKLVPGPNNTFTLVEEHANSVEKPAAEPPVEDKPQGRGKKRKTNESSSSNTKHHRANPVEKSSSPDLVEVNQNQESQSKPEPYPVGLFVGATPVPHHSSTYPTPNPPVPFTTPAMKKQSYTIVQTGNPSKLLISTKPQPVPEDISKKKSKKKSDANKEPYNVALEETPQPKDPGFFTFISVDPLLQPSYVLPTDNIIQESQISTSTPVAKPAPEKEKDKYSCNMCGEHFSREKKLLSHIQSHYNQMDEEDQMRAEKTVPKKKTRRS